ncbi:G5 domain-containing protein [Curtobacterium sp. RRHDQ10]|uniref:G5 domain-containing protein n=1 Tax=Curtobacterium phyllosphaerae TaxID=3413379 RepID=UPI003BEFF5F2
MPYTSTTVDDPTVAKGTSRVTTAGADGVLTTTYEVTKTDGVETGRTQVSQSVTTPPVTQVTSNGTYVAPVPAPAAPAAPDHGVVNPGGFCSASDRGVTAQAANGRSYTCGGKGPDASGRLHWNS